MSGGLRMPHERYVPTFSRNDAVGTTDYTEGTDIPEAEAEDKKPLHLLPIGWRGTPRSDFRP
jgi:hypothetical protein